MADKKQLTTSTESSLFGKENYKWMLIGAVVIGIGFILMSGGKSESSSIFQKEEVYSFRRITLAPIIILLGLGIEVFAIFRKPKS